MALEQQLLSFKIGFPHEHEEWMHISVNDIVHENKSLIRVAYVNEEVVEGAVHVPIVKNDMCCGGRGEEETVKLSHHGISGSKCAQVISSIVQEFCRFECLNRNSCLDRIFNPFLFHRRHEVLDIRGEQMVFR